MSPNSNQSQAVLTGARQTMMAWSKVIESEAEIPEIYRPALEPLLAASPNFPHLVLAPPLDKFLRRTTEKLVCDSPQAMHILESSKGQVLRKSYPYQNIVMLEVGVVLLNSWFSIHGFNSEGEAGRSTIEINTTSDRYYAAFLKKIRPAAEENSASQLKAEKDKFDYLSDPNFKFMNYARNSLVAGETVLQSLLQPEIRQPVWKIFGWTYYRVMSLAHLAILTDKELILIRDDERARGIRESRHGGVWQYIPLGSIRSVAIEAGEAELLHLSIDLSSGETLKKIFAAASKSELERLRNELQARLGK